MIHRFLIEDQQGKLAQVEWAVAQLPLAVMASARSVFSIDSGKCYKLIDSLSKVPLRQFLESLGIELDNVQVAKPLSVGQVRLTYAFANYEAGFYCGRSPIDTASEAPTTETRQATLYVLRDAISGLPEVRVSHIDPDSGEDLEHFLSESFVVFSSNDPIKRDAHCNIFCNIMQAAGVKIIYR